jgi:hypothetical protein
MAASVRNFYVELAGEYNLMFEDWEASIACQAAALGPILERECGPASLVTPSKTRQIFAVHWFSNVYRLNFEE